MPATVVPLAETTTPFWSVTVAAPPPASPRTHTPFDFDPDTSRPSSTTDAPVPTRPRLVVPIGLKPTLFVTYTPTPLFDRVFVPPNVTPGEVPHTITP